MGRKPPPDGLDLADINGHQIRFVFAEGGLVLRVGNWCHHIQADDALTLLRWLLWHALHGRWKPKE